MASGENGPVAVPYLTGSPAGIKPTTGGWAGPLGDDAHGGQPKGPANPMDGINGFGGFIPIKDMPPAPDGSDPGFADMMGGMLENLPQQVAQNWMIGAVQNAMLGGGPDGVMSAAMGALGVNNPLASGPFASVLGAAANAAGVGQVANLLPGLGGMLGGGGSAAFGNALGSMGLNQALNAAGLGDIPGSAAAANILGGQLGNVFPDLDLGIGDMLDDSLNGIAGPIDGCFGDLGSSPDGGILDERPDGIDTDAITEQGLDAATDQLLSQWQVDDESSAAEHIAHKAVNDYKAEIQDVLKGEVMGTEGGGVGGLIDRIESFFSGAEAGTGFPAARITDPDVTKPEIVDLGVANILAEKLPISRISDTLAPSKAMILAGSATVLSAGLPTARMTSKTDSPGVMIEKGAMSVLVGGVTASIDPPPAASDPSIEGNAGPKGPQDAASASSGSGQGESGGTGDGTTNEAGESNQGNQGQQEDGQQNANEQDGKQQGEGQQGEEENKEQSDNDLKKIEDAGEVVEGAKKAETGAKAASGLEQERLDKEAKQAKADAQTQADNLKGEAEQSKAEYEAKQAEAERAANDATAKQHGAQSADDFKDAVEARQDATKAQQTASDAKAKLDADTNAARNAQKVADDLPTKGTLKGAGKVLETASKYGGPALEVAATGVSVAKMKELGEQGENRALIREAGSAIGGLAAGAATLAIASTGVGIVFLVAGGVAMGIAGSAVGDQVGDAVADRYGYENRSGKRENTWWEDTKNGAGVIQDSVSGLFDYW